MPKELEPRVAALETDMSGVKERLSRLESQPQPVKDVDGMTDYILGAAVEEAYENAVRNRTSSPKNTDEPR